MSKPTLDIRFSRKEEGKERRIQVSDEQYDFWQKQIDALKPKKRKNWKSCLYDQWGRKSRVQYNSKLEVFENWSLLGHCWARVDSFSYVMKHFYQDPSCIIKETSAIGEVTAHAARTTGEDIADEVLDAAVAANHTGNHYRNTTIKVPANVYG